MPELRKLGFGWPSNEVGISISFNHEAPESLRGLFIRFFSEFIEISESISIHSMHEGNDLGGNYEISINNEDRYFFRISERMGFPEIEKEICDYLVEQGCNANTILKTEYFEENEVTYRADLRPFVQGRHFDYSCEDIEIAVKGLRKVHDALKHFNHKEIVRRNQESRASIHARI